MTAAENLHLGRFRWVQDWLFDLDNVLYPTECRLFDQIDQRMGSYISELLSLDHDDAKRVQKDYFHRFGTTLNGLMKLHGIEPEHFLDYVHDIDASVVPPHPELGELIERLPGRKIVYTNGNNHHARNVTQQLGIDGVFDDIFDITAGSYIPKPKEGSYNRMIQKTGVNPQSTAFFEDIARNLEPAKARGMVTVWIPNDYSWARAGSTPEDAAKADEELGRGGPFIDYIADDLAGFLERVCDYLNV